MTRIVHDPPIFEIEQPVMFQHCDPAGIVFYPRYFEMINATVERWFSDALAWPFARMHLEDGAAVPTASIAADFTAPSHLGDVLLWRLIPSAIGGSRIDLEVSAASQGEMRVTARATLVHVSMSTKRPQRWPDWFRDRLTITEEPS